MIVKNSEGQLSKYVEELTLNETKWKNELKHWAVDMLRQSQHIIR